MYGGEYKIKETIEKLQRIQYISSVDFYKGFNHFVLREEDGEYTAFSLKDRHLHYNRCSQGIKTRPAYFSMSVANTFRPCRQLVSFFLLFNFHRTSSKMNNAQRGIILKNFNFIL